MSGREYDGRVSVPVDFARGPLFAALPQKIGRVVLVGTRQYQIGGFSPLGIGEPCPALDVRHLRACLALLSFRDPYRPDAPLRPSITGLCRRYSNCETSSGGLAQCLRGLLNDLLRCYLKVSESGGQERVFRILERVCITRRPARHAGRTEMECWVEELRFSAEFSQLLSDFESLTRLRLDVLNSIASPIAQALYAYVPSRAVHHDSTANAWEIRLGVALAQLGVCVPMARSQRKRIFLQNGETRNGSILSQLNGAELLDAVLHAEVVPTRDETDYKLRFWTERHKIESRPCAVKGEKLLAAWLASGRSEEEYRRRLRIIEPLSSYEIELLEIGQVDRTQSDGFLKVARCLLGERRFIEFAAESKGDALAIGGFRPVNPTGLLIHRLIEAIRYGKPNKPALSGMVNETSHALPVWQTKQGAESDASLRPV